MSNNQLPIQYNSTNLTIKYPNNSPLKTKNQTKIQTAVTNGGIATANAKGFIEKSSLPTLLATDKKGADKVYNNADDEDKYENGSKKYLSIPATEKEMSKRIQEPRSTTSRKKIQYAQECVKAFRDAPELETVRQLKCEEIDKELPKVTRKKMKSENITTCQLSGEPFNNDAEGHHITRKADSPDDALDPNNIVVIKAPIHTNIHFNEAESPEALKQYISDNNYATPSNLK